jgi:DNA-binding response OmpR family regulator
MPLAFLRPISGGPLRTILLIEDDFELSRALAAIFDDHGYRVVVAYDGEEAFTKLMEMSSCDGVLLDLQLPRLNGRELLQRIRSYVRFVDLPVLAFTAFDTVAPGLLADVFLKKPVPYDVLVGHIDALSRVVHRMSTPQPQVH